MEISPRKIWLSACLGIMPVSGPGKGKAVSGNQLISQSNSIYRILYVQGNMEDLVGDTRKTKLEREP